MDAIQLAATLAVPTDLEYKDHCARQLQHLDLLEQVPDIADYRQYCAAMEVSSVLCALSCFTSNTRHATDDRVWRLERCWNLAIAKYVRRYLDLSNAEHILVANYAISPRFYVDASTRGDVFLREVVPYLVARAILQRTERGVPVVVGLRKKLGDNCFKVDRHRRHHRQYVDTAALLAIPLASRYVDQLEPHTLALIDKHTHVASVGDRKGAVRTPSFARDLPRKLRAAFSWAEHGDRPREIGQPALQL